MDDLPEANFLNFLSGLASQALMQFGEIPNPQTNQRAANPAFARYTVQLLHVLQEKTTGNLSPEEASYLESMLSDLDNRLQQLPASE